MGKVNFTIKMEGCMKDSGLMDISKVMGNYFISLRDWLMMGNGKMTNFNYTFELVWRRPGESENINSNLGAKNYCRKGATF